jgi:hypothetical protein
MRVSEFGGGASLRLGQAGQPFAEQFSRALGSSAGDLAADDRKAERLPTTGLILQTPSIAAVDGERFGIALGALCARCCRVQLHDLGRVFESDVFDPQTHFYGQKSAKNEASMCVSAAACRSGYFIAGWQILRPGSSQVRENHYSTPVVITNSTILNHCLDRFD